VNSSTNTTSLRRSTEMAPTVPGRFNSPRGRLIVFAAATFGAGIIGRLLDGSHVDALTPQPGQALWLIGPLVAGVALTWLARQPLDWGLKPRLSTAAPWYLFAAAIFPVLTVALVAAGRGFGSINVDPDLVLGAAVSAVLLAVPSSFIKNIFEELAWRGYLMAELGLAIRSRLGLHLVVGVVWGLWHVPYLDAFTEISHGGRWELYGPLFLLGVLPTAVVYGEVRLRSGTVWPAVVMHTMANATANTLVVEDYISVDADRFWTIGPSLDNVGYIVIMTLVAVVLMALPRPSPSAAAG